jgi:hypothetical protein
MESDVIDISEFRLQRERERLIEHHGIKPYEDIREHYIIRLKERYGITITEAEYDDILDRFKRNDFIKMYSLSYNRKVVWVKVKGRYIFSIYNKKISNLREGALLTCLEFNSTLRMPVPKIFGINGFRPADFEKSVNETIEEAFTLLNDYYEMGTKDFFMKHPANKNHKSIIHFWAKSGEIELDRVIDYMENKFKEDGTFKITEIKY